MQGEHEKNVQSSGRRIFQLLESQAFWEKAGTSQLRLLFLGASQGFFDF